MQAVQPCWLEREGRGGVAWGWVEWGFWFTSHITMVGDTPRDEHKL